MNKHIVQTAFWIAIILTVATTSMAANFSYEDTTQGVKLAKRSGAIFELEINKVEIKPGLSEIQKKNARVQTAVRTSPVISEILSLEQLRALYKEAGAKYGIDWRLIEAVHQVESGKSGSTCKSSYAGATGPMQFLPSTFRVYAEPGSNICDLRSSIFAAANLLARAGASSGDIDSALFSYNHSLAYVRLVKSVMESIRV
ncbi:MAG: lytic transglycosylase domain-containing protein [Candidatus Berkelbacteria bacterium]|nr:lytic transglycosylase domain-containing protein [Candidatus Berkelbacteria bacterium]